MVSDPYGRVNSRFASEPAISAASAAGTTPPISALASTPSRKINNTVDNASSARSGSNATASTLGISTAASQGQGPRRMIRGAANLADALAAFWWVTT